MSAIRSLLIPAVLLLAACSREQPPVDPQLAAAIAGIKAIDNHAHPVLTAPGDREFDALPVDNMEPQSDPVAMRPAPSRRRSPPNPRPPPSGSAATDTPPGCRMTGASRRCWPIASPWDRR